MALGMEVGLGPCYIVLDGDLPSKRGTAARLIFGPCLLWPNGWMNQGKTWHRGRPRSRPQCFRWGPSSPPKKGHKFAEPQFLVHVCCGQTAGWIKMPLGSEVDLGPGTAPPILAHVLWPNGCMDQDATLYCGRPRSRPHCVT